MPGRFKEYPTAAAANEAAPEWNIWFPDDPGTLTLSELRPGTVTGRDDDADIQAMRLGAGYSGVAAASYSELWANNGRNVDNLLYFLGAWSSTPCTVDDLAAPGVPFCLRQ